MKFLIVDDSELARQMVVSQLKELGYTQFVIAQSGEEALRKLEECRKANSQVDMIITDLRMPTMQGSELIKQLREIPNLKDIPVLILSVETERGTILEAVAKGASGYILKPVTSGALKTKIEQILNKKQA